MRAPTALARPCEAQRPHQGEARPSLIVQHTAAGGEGTTAHPPRLPPQRAAPPPGVAVTASQGLASAVGAHNRPPCPATAPTHPHHALDTLCAC